jgi:hypothetical protein
VASIDELFESAERSRTVVLLCAHFFTFVDVTRLWELARQANESLVLVSTLLDPRIMAIADKCAAGAAESVLCADVDRVCVQWQRVSDGDEQLYRVLFACLGDWLRVEDISVALQRGARHSPEFAAALVGAVVARGGKQHRDVVSEIVRLALAPEAAVAGVAVVVDRSSASCDALSTPFAATSSCSLRLTLRGSWPRTRCCTRRVT